jgi:DnaJ family protein B protein 4
MAKPHDVLGVAPDATLDEARAAFRRLAMKHHPDRPGGDAETFTALRAAFENFERRAKSVGVFDDLLDDAVAENKK